MNGNGGAHAKARRTAVEMLDIEALEKTLEAEAQKRGGDDRNAVEWWRVVLKSWLEVQKQRRSELLHCLGGGI